MIRIVIKGNKHETSIALDTRGILKLHTERSPRRTKGRFTTWILPDSEKNKVIEWFNTISGIEFSSGDPIVAFLGCP